MRETEIETLRRLVMTLKRRRFGRSSEKQHPDQLALGIEAIEEQLAALKERIAAREQAKEAAEETEAKDEDEKDGSAE